MDNSLHLKKTTIVGNSGTVHKQSKYFGLRRIYVVRPRFGITRLRSRVLVCSGRLIDWSIQAGDEWIKFSAFFRFVLMREMFSGVPLRNPNEKILVFDSKKRSTRVMLNCRNIVLLDTEKYVPHVMIRDNVNS